MQRRMVETRTWSDPTLQGRVAQAGTGLLLAVAAFQIALVAGAPWGRFAWGGGNEGTLPPALRASSAVSALVAVGLSALMAAGPVTPARRRGLQAAGVLFAAGTVMNAVSPSVGERATWTPVAAALTVLFWLRAATRHYHV